MPHAALLCLIYLLCTKVWTDNCHGHIFEATIVIVMMIIFGFGCANLMTQPKFLCFFYDYGYDGATRDVLVLVLLASLVSSVPTLAGPGLGVGIRLLLSKPSRSTTAGSHPQDDALAGNWRTSLVF